MNEKIKGPLFITAAAILWSTGGLLVKMNTWDTMVILGMRSFFAAIVLVLYMRRPRITFSPSVIIGAVCLSVTNFFFVFCTQLTTAANAIVLQYTMPVFVLIISAIFFKKRMRLLDIVSVLLVFAGIALFFLDQLRPTALLGNILACLSGITFSGLFLVKQMPNTKPEEAFLLGFLINIVVSLPFIFTSITFEPVSWISIVILGVLQQGLGFVFFTIGIKHVQPVAASLIATTEPLLNPLWVFLILGEIPGPWALAGGAIVIVTITVYNIIAAKKPDRQKI